LDRKRTEREANEGGGGYSQSYGRCRPWAQPRWHRQGRYPFRVWRLDQGPPLCRPVRRRQRAERSNR